MEKNTRGSRYAGTLLSLVLGAGAVVGGAYVVSRLREKQEAETRLERMERMLDDICGPETAGKNKT